MSPRSVRPVVAGERVRRARELRGLTQKQLAERSEGAFSPPALSQIERNLTQPTAQTLNMIAQATGMPVAYFTVRSNEEEKEGFFRSLRSTSATDRRSH